MIGNIASCKQVISCLSIFHSRSTYGYALRKNCSTCSTHVFLYPFPDCGQRRSLRDRLRTQFFTGSQFLLIGIVLNGNRHSCAFVEACCPCQILCIHTEASYMDATAVKFAEGMV